MGRGNGHKCKANCTAPLCHRRKAAQKAAGVR